MVGHGLLFWSAALHGAGGIEHTNQNEQCPVQHEHEYIDDPVLLGFTTF